MVFFFSNLLAVIVVQVLLWLKNILLFLFSESLCDFMSNLIYLSLYSKKCPEEVDHYGGERLDRDGENLGHSLKRKINGEKIAFSTSPIEGMKLNSYRINIAKRKKLPCWHQTWTFVRLIKKKKKKSKWKE